MTGIARRIITAFGPPARAVGDKASAGAGDPDDEVVTVVLLTGMSGAGESTALAGLARLGFQTIDTDEAGWIESVDDEPLWRPDRIEEALRGPRSTPLVLLGTVANQGEWADRFAALVLLTAPVEVLTRRLRDRPSGQYGSSDADQAQVARDAAEVEPLLRMMATHVVDTSDDRETVVAKVASIVRSTR
jgi:shikimate kinase